MTIEQRINELAANAADTLSKLRQMKKDNPEYILGFIRTNGGILNAYREGDISFNAAIQELDAIQNEKMQKILRRQNELETKSTNS